MILIYTFEVDSNWMWEFINNEDESVKRCQQNQFGCNPKTFWADGQLGA